MEGATVVSGPLAATPRRFRILVALLGIAVVLAALASICSGAVAVGIPAVLEVIGAHLGVGPGSPSTVDEQIVWSIRMPRTLMAVVVGAGLAICGVVIQAVVRNPLGDPYLIGIMPGASLGAVAVIVGGGAALGGLSMSGAAFIGGLLAFAAVFVLGRQNGSWPPARLVLAGVAVGYLVSSFTYFLQILATPNQVQRVLFWSLGSVAGATWDDLPLVAVIVILAIAVLLVNAQRLNALSAGTDLTATLGINVARLQLMLMLITALASGAIVAVAGGIGFVGLVVPHIARLLVGADHRRVLITATLLGASFLTVADIAARLVRAPAELPIGIVTAAVGAPFFLWLLTHPSRGSRATRARSKRLPESPSDMVKIATPGANA
ncbi:MULTISPECIES: iron ABC transporter permease [Actinomycetes]|uniref:FecCD family ABC transporter permease n=1 Tax=Actinomycetes TaxID=1760 RepID=UPI000B309F00|nr:MULTISPECIES: iron ABC transporter permease [Actinomycetes]